MPKLLNASAIVDQLQSLHPSKQTMLRYLKQGGIAVIALGSLYLIAPPLWDAISVSPQQRVKPLKQRIEDLDKQIKASSPRSTVDLKEIATLEKGRIDSENTIRTSLFQAVGGLLVFVTLYISWLTLKANEAKQVAERFSKAVEQLGNDNIHVRLGGIYALEQIAKDAEEKYYWQVMETLTSYVRERSPYPPKAAKTHSSFVQAALEPAKASETQSNEAIPPLPTDIQAVMTVLARRKHTYGHPLERHPLDLHGADLRRLQLPPNAQLNQADLAGTNLQGASLEEVNLQWANLEQANLQQVKLQQANLQRANLIGANLWKVDLRGTKLYGVNLQGANLRSANLSSQNLQAVILLGADLLLADLREANLKKVDLCNTNLQGAKLNHANLEDTRLWNANLQETNLEGASLQRAKLWNANLQGAKLKDTDLRGVEFKISVLNYVSIFGADEAVGLTWEELNSAAFYEKDCLPSYLRLQPPQLKEMLTAALNAVRVLAASYKNVEQFPPFTQ